MTASAPHTSSNRSVVLVVVGVIVIGLLGIAVLATGDSSDRSEAAAEQTAPVEIVGDSLTFLPQEVKVATAANDPIVGSIAPTLIATDFDGTEVTIGADGRPKVIYFLAHWCSHCQAEVPVIQKLIDEGSQPEGLDIYAVSTAVDEGGGNFPPQFWLEDEHFAPVTVRDDQSSSALAAFGGSGFPFVVYLDGNNQVVARSAGGLDKDVIVELWATTAAS